jgi:hypothetical protein
MAICPKCKKQNPDGAIFCLRCDRRLPSVVEPSESKPLDKKYNKYAISSLVCSVVGLLITLMFIVISMINYGSIFQVEDIYTHLLLGGLCSSILGIILGIIGQKSQKVNISQISCIVSSFLSVIIMFYYVINGMLDFIQDFSF